MTLLAVLVAAVTPAPAPALPPGCDHVHRPRVAINRTGMLLRNTRPRTRRTDRRLVHYRRCLTEPGARPRVRQRALRLSRWRRQYRQRWRIRFNALPAWAQAWAWSTGACESGNNPRAATGNGFFGAHQWLPSTWVAADHTGMWVTDASWHHQAVVAVRWLYIAGDEQWPNCGD